MKNNLESCVKALLQEAKENGKPGKPKRVDDECWIYVEAYGHKYIIKNPYTKKCKIIQEDANNDNLHY